MTSDTLSLLFIGISLIVIGIIACRHYQWKQAKGYIPLLVGLSFVFLTTLGPLSHIKERSKAVTHSDSSRIAPLSGPGK